MRVHDTLHALPIPDRWALHSYYTCCPYAPDGSGRILAAGTELDNRMGEVFILSPQGDVLDCFGQQPVSPSFWHTGFWQSWSPDARAVYYQGGTLQQPVSVRRDLETGEEARVAGDLEGIPPSGEPGVSCSHGLLYAAGYGDNRWKPEQAPVPFLARDQHGMSLITFDPRREELILSTHAVLDTHPERDRLLAAERELKTRLGEDEGLTLMTYCVRWNRQGTRFLFYFGNHCVVKERGEPRLSYVFTADRDLQDIRLAVNLSFDRRGVHWGWQPDGETLIGYGPRPDGQPGFSLAEVRWDGSDYRILSEHNSGGHPSASPRDRDLIVTDEGGPEHGNVVFISRRTGAIIERVPLPKFIGPREPPGRNPLRVCHHPVFNQRGDRILCNSLPGRHATLTEIRL